MEPEILIAIAKVTLIVFVIIASVVLLTAWGVRRERKEFEDQDDWGDQ